MQVLNDAVGGAGSFSSNLLGIFAGGLQTAVTRTVDKYVPAEPNQLKAVDAKGGLQNAATPTTAPSALDAAKGWITNPFVIVTSFAAIILVVVLVAKR